MVLVLVLDATSLVLAGTARTPVDVFVASGSRIAVRAVARVILNMVVTRGAVQARRTVAFVNPVLTV